VLVQDHKSQPGDRWLRLRRWSFRRIAGIAFTSSEQAEPFVEAGLLRPRTPVFQVAESSCTFAPGDRAEARRASGVHGDPALLWVGHLNANKDPLTILEAVRKALPQLPDLQLWCAFDSVALLPEVERMLRADQRLAARVHLLGRVPHDQVETLCRACDLFVLGSRHEGSGYALLEALACGLPPVVSDIAPFRGLTGNGAVGALAPVGDAEAFAAGIVQVANAPRHETRAAVLAHFARTLSPDALGQRLLSVYEQLAQDATRQ
jgi:glycosyltransferase involved in cell wall biosynthesis